MTTTTKTKKEGKSVDQADIKVLIDQSIEKVKEFSSNTYGVNFELFDKVHAKGNTTAPYDCLINADPAGDVEWNFEKFLISKEGIVLARFKSAVDPQDPQLIQAIELALAT